MTVFLMIGWVFILWFLLYLVYTGYKDIEKDDSMFD